jgi:hypothetical protein
VALVLWRQILGFCQAGARDTSFKNLMIDHSIYQIKI